MRRLPSRYCAELGALACVLVLAGLWSATRVAAAGEPGLCPVYEERYAAPASVECADPGVTAGAPAPAGAGIVPLPAPRREATSTAPAGGALLVLPKLPGGSLPTDFELGPDAAIEESYWSPVLCSTIARVTGPPGSTLAALVPKAPAAGTVVENTRYVTAAVRLRPAPEPGSPDPHFGLQYGLEQSGARAARSITNGAGARVALLDSAPDTAHPDLQGIRLESLGAGAAPTPAAHGTLMAGVISARENNGFGIAGVAPGADLVAIPVCRPEASLADHCGLYSLLRGIDRAFEVEAHVINLSLVGPANSLLERAVDRLDGLGVVVVAAAGNEGTSEPRYPAAYSSVVGVGAVDVNRAAFARGNSGPSVELTAPGVAVLSTVPGASFAFGDGTSLAAAHVSGMLALLVGAGSTPLDARTALFEAGNALPSAVGLATPLAPVCDALARLGSPCTP